MITIRKIVPADKKDIQDISKNIWDGNDYVPYVFDRWVADEEGEFTAVLSDDVIVGFGRLTFITPTDAWMEGLRADQNAQVRGIGKALTEHYLNIVSNHDELTSLRFATYYNNMASIVSSQKRGFELLFKMSNKFYDLQNDDTDYSATDITSLQPPVTLEEMCDYIEGSEFLIKSHNFICIAWICYPYTRSFIKECFLKPKRYLIYKDKGTIQGILLYDLEKAVNSNKHSTLSFIKADTEDIAGKLINAHKKIATESNREKIEIKVPKETMAWHYIDKAGFESREIEDDFLVFEYPLNKLNKRDKDS